MRKCLFLSSIFLMITFGLQAQSTQLKRANELYKKGQYRQSIPLYLSILDEMDSADAKTKLANAYRQIGDFETASQWYGLVVGLPNSTPDQKLYYGMTLLWTDQCEAAEKWFKEYLTYKPYDIRKPLLLDACNYYHKIKSQNQHKIGIQHLSINSPVDDYAPAIYRDGLVYTSSLDGANEEGKIYTNLYFAARAEEDSLGEFEDPKSFSSNLNTLNFHEGIASFNADQTQIFFTRTRNVPDKLKINGKSPLEITSGRLLPQGSWSELKPLPMSNNTYSVAHPSISKDGTRLYFSSNMPGGFGGTDLYLAVYENGAWGPPVNLGPAINTVGNEYFPHITADGKLYFSSDGHLGLGGQDIYWTSENEEALWKRPENLGYPINSESEDFAIVINESGLGGYFTSNREGGSGGDDIYSFNIIGKAVSLNVVNLQTGLPIPNATIQQSNNETPIRTDEQGQALAFISGCSQFTGVAEEYESKNIEVCEYDQEADTIYVALALRLKANHQFTGMVYDETTGRVLSNVKIEAIQTDCTIPNTVYSDQSGHFTINLSSSCCYAFRFEKTGYASAKLKGDICTTNEANIEVRDIVLSPINTAPTEIQDTSPVSINEPAPTVEQEEDFSSEEGFNEREEIIGFEKSKNSDAVGEEQYLLNVYYNVGRSSVSVESVPELKKLLKALQQNKSLIVEVQSHTDANGQDYSNLQLSQRRADAIVRYLVKNGIRRDRLVAKGYGESTLVNDCSDDVPCSESQHQENRRTEFKVIGRL